MENQSVDDHKTGLNQRFLSSSCSLYNIAAIIKKLQSLLQAGANFRLVDGCSMETEYYINLTHNTSLLLAVVVLYDITAARWTIGKSKRQQVLAGLFLGAISLVIISTTWPLIPGELLDVRSILFAVTGLFFGAIPSLIGAVFSAFFHLCLGGIDEWIGVILIFASMAIGLIWRHYRRERLSSLSWGDLYLMGLAVHIVMLALLFLLPWEIASEVLSRIAAPVLLIYPLGVMLFGKFLSWRLHREESGLLTRESEEKYRALYNSVMDPVLVADIDTGIFIECNQAAEEFLGRTRSDIIGLHQRELHPPEDINPEGYSKHFAQEVKRPGTANAVRFLRPDGEIVLADVSTSSFQLQGKNLLLGVFHDVTEIKRTEAALRASEASLNLAAETGGLGLWDWQVAEDTATLSDYCLSMKGLVRDEFSGSIAQWDNAIHKDDHERVWAALTRHLNGETERFEAEYRFWRNDREWYWEQVSGKVIEWDANGQPLRMLGYHKDISDKKETELRLQETTAILMAAMDNSTAGVAIADAPDGKLRYVNKAGLAIREGGPETLVDGVVAEDYVSVYNIHYLDRTPYRKNEDPLARAILNGEHVIEEFLMLRPSGEFRNVMVNAAPVLNEDGAVSSAVVVFFDITDTRKIEQGLEMFFAMSLDLICIVDILSSKFVKVNPAFFKVLGYTEEELLESSFMDFIHPEDAPEAQLILEEKLRKGEAVLHFENRYRSKNGEYRWLSWVSHPQLEQGVTYALARDVTEWKKAMQRIQESEAKYRALFSEAVDPILVTEDETGMIIECNQTAERFFGIPRERFLGMHYEVILPQWDWAHGKSATVQDYLSKVGDANELTVMAAGGVERFISLRTSMFTLNGRQVVMGMFRDITEQRIMQDALQFSEERFDNAMRAVNDGLWDLNIETDEVFFSPRLYEMLDFAPNELPASYETWLSLLHPEDKERAAGIVNGVIQNTSERMETASFSMEMRMRRKNGGWKWILSRGGVTKYNDAGLPVRLTGTHVDITERKHLFEELRKSQERLALAVEGTLVGLWDWRVQSGEVYFNEQWAIMVGYTLKELEPLSIQTWMSLCHPEDLERSEKSLQDHFQGKTQFYQCEARMRHKDGHWIWILDQGKVVEWDEQGAPIRMAGTHQDITERKNVEQALKESEEHYRSLFDSTPNPIFVYDPEKDRFVNANPAATAMYGFSLEEFKKLGKKDISAELARTEEVVQQLAGSEKPLLVSRRKHKNKSGGILTVSMTSSPVRLRGKLFHSTIIQDISAQVEHERKLVEAKEAAEEASKAKSEFLANMSHEIRTPMNGVLGMLQLLQMTGINEEQKEYVLSAIQSSKRLTRLLSDILDLSRVEANRLTIQSQPMNLVELLKQTCELFKSTAQQIKIEQFCYVDPGVPSVVNGDAPRLQQVLTNLIGNAFKFTKEGRIVVEAYPLVTSDSSQVRVLFSVTDTGIGITDEKIKQLFQPFSQVNTGYRRDYQGAGLGLSICKKLIELMGGTIAIESEPGEGTTVHFCITFGVGEPVMKQEVSSPGIGRSKQLRILLAEDENVNSLATTKLLEKKGHTVKAAKDGQEAIALLKEDSFDVILMDIQMPVMDGVGATKAIRGGDAGQDKKDIPIIAMTAYAMGGDKEKFLEAGMNGYIAKPVDMDEHQRVVTEALETAKAKQ